MRAAAGAMLAWTGVLAAAMPSADAAPAAAACEPTLQADLVLSRLNELRAGARSCGAQRMPVAPPLRWDERLVESARIYVQELAARDQLSHEGRAQRSLRERLRQSGYRLRLGGETLSAGPETLDQALELWLASAAHCENLMAAEFRDVGLACAAGPGRYGHFWVLHLGQELRD